MFDDEARRAGLNVPHFEVLVLGRRDQTAGTLLTQRQSRARVRVRVQLPDGLVVARVDVVDAARLGAAQEAVRVEVVPEDAFDFGVQLPRLGTLAAAVVDARLAVAAAGQKCLHFKRMELQTLNLLRVLQLGGHRLLAHVPQQHRMVG